MTFWGLHWLDISIVLCYFGSVLAIGQFLSSKIKGQNDFYLAGRKLGKTFQFFLNFGQMTDSSGATSTASVVYKQGVGGVWINFQTLLMTPYYWFMYLWFRRVRLITVADLFEDRFGGKFLSGLYALFTIYWSIMMIGWGNLVACKTIQPIMVKPPESYTISEAQMVKNYSDFIKLREMNKTGALSEKEITRYNLLKGLYDRGELNSYVSYLSPLVFYLISGSIVAIYIILGGLAATAVINALQALLTIFFSVILIPFGLLKLGGFSGMHNLVPDYMFQIFGSEATSEYTWYSILAIFFASLIGIHSIQSNMGIGGSAKNELSARFGAVSGGFGKRFIIMAWTLCGLIAFGLYGNSLSDPDNAWGALTRDLLPIGAIGMMLAGILAAKMAALGAQAITLSALLVRNLYLPLFPEKDEKHYIFVGRIAIAVLLACGILVAMFMTGIISLLKDLTAMTVVFGAPILLIFFWRRLTKAAVIYQVIICILIIIVIPYIVSATPSLKSNQGLILQTNGRTHNVEIRASEQDVKTGLAQKTGLLIAKKYYSEPVSLFFEGLAHTDSRNPNSPIEGLGRFNIEVYLIYLLGFDLTNITPAGLMTIRFMVDGLLPFILLLIFSCFTTATDKARCDRFYVRMKTPVGPTPEADAIEIEKSYSDPTRFDHLKIFPKSNWEICKWDRQDFIGFALCWLMVTVILILFWLMLNIGRLHL